MYKRQIQDGKKISVDTELEDSERTSWLNPCLLYTSPLVCSLFAEIAIIVSPRGEVAENMYCYVAAS